MEDIEDPINLTGIHKILNVENTESEQDLAAIEREFLGKVDLRTIPTVDPVEEFRNTLRELSADVGMAFEEEIDTVSPEVALPEVLPDLPPPLTFSAPAVEEFTERRREAPVHSPLDQALDTYCGYSEAKREERFKKTLLLEEIRALRRDLVTEGENLKDIPEPDENTPLTTIQEIHDLLQGIYDRYRCQSFGTEIIMMAVQGLEYVFNGERQFGPWKPDIVGYHNTLRPKLRRMQYDTSRAVIAVSQKMGIGSFGRSLFELLISLFLYSKKRQEQKLRDQHTPDQISEALDELQQLQ